jgi:hypothetical protein
MASSIGIIISLYIVFTVIIITLLHWYKIMLALKASAQCHQMKAVCGQGVG